MYTILLETTILCLAIFNADHIRDAGSCSVPGENFRNATNQAELCHFSADFLLGSGEKPANQPETGRAVTLFGQKPPQLFNVEA
jgi:hypothetical protein